MNARRREACDGLSWHVCAHRWWTAAREVSWRRIWVNCWQHWGPATSVNSTRHKEESAISEWNQFIICQLGVFLSTYMCISSPPLQGWCRRPCWADPEAATPWRCCRGLCRSRCTPDPCPPPGRSRSPRSAGWTEADGDGDLIADETLRRGSCAQLRQRMWRPTLLFTPGWQSSNLTPKALGPAFFVFFMMLIPHGDFGGTVSSKDKLITNVDSLI